MVVVMIVLENVRVVRVLVPVEVMVLVTLGGVVFTVLVIVVDGSVIVLGERVSE